MSSCWSLEGNPCIQNFDPVESPGRNLIKLRKREVGLQWVSMLKESVWSWNRNDGVQSTGHQFQQIWVFEREKQTVKSLDRFHLISLYCAYSIHSCIICITTFSYMCTCIHTQCKCYNGAWCSALVESMSFIRRVMGLTAVLAAT